MEGDVELFVFLADDGSIYIRREWSGEAGWATGAELDAALAEAKQRHARVAYARESPIGEPPPGVLQTFRRMVQWELPMRLTVEDPPARDD